MPLHKPTCSVEHGVKRRDRRELRGHRRAGLGDLLAALRGGLGLHPRHRLVEHVPADGVSDGDESMSYRTPFAVELIYADRTRGFPLARSPAIGWILRCGLNVRAAPGLALRRGLDQPTIAPLGGYRRRSSYGFDSTRLRRRPICAP